MKEHNCPVEEVVILSDSRHLRSRYGHIAIKSLKVDYGL